MNPQNVTFDRATAFTRRWLEPLLAGALILSVVCYYFLSNSKTNNFPTYLAGLACLAASWRWARGLSRSWVLISTVLLCAYLALSLFWSKPLYDEEIHSIVGNFVLVVLYVVGLVICLSRFPGFNAWLCQAIVLAASLSAAVFLITAVAVDHEVTTAPLGRWTTPSVGAIGYGIACILAINLALMTHRPRYKLGWLALAGVLAVSCVYLRTDYVLFALLAALTAVAMGQLWRRRTSPLAFVWVVVCFVLMVAVILALNVVIDHGRQLIWSSVLDLIYKEKLTFGFGIRSRPSFHIDCNLEALRAAVPDCAFRHPHNLYVSTMFYGGVIGIAGLVLLMIASMSSAMGVRRSSRWLAVSTLTYGFAVLMFDGNRLIAKIDFVWLVFWLPVALAAHQELEGQLDNEWLPR